VVDPWNCGDYLINALYVGVNSSDMLRAGHLTILSIPLLREGMAMGNIQVRRKSDGSQPNKSLFRTFAPMSQ
jgi:hypothetical protein